MIEREAAHLVQAKETRAAAARQRFALHILCGIDMDAVMAARPAERRHAAGLVERRLKRERLKGLNGHWSYDLNRHIALKQALVWLKTQDV